MEKIKENFFFVPGYLTDILMKFSPIFFIQAYIIGYAVLQTAMLFMPDKLSITEIGIFLLLRCIAFLPSAESLSPSSQT